MDLYISCVLGSMESGVGVLAHDTSDLVAFRRGTTDWNGHLHTTYQEDISYEDVKKNTSFFFFFPHFLKSKAVVKYQQSIASQDVLLRDGGCLCLPLTTREASNTIEIVIIKYRSRYSLDTKNLNHGIDRRLSR